MWILLVLLVPFYGLLQRHNDEIRLSVYSWTLTITVFAAFGLAALDAEYIPFLLLATLATAIMLTGYSIDIRKAWGVPFRWFGCEAGRRSSAHFIAAGIVVRYCPYPGISLDDHYRYGYLILAH